MNECSTHSAVGPDVSFDREPQATGERRQGAGEDE